MTGGTLTLAWPWVLLALPLPWVMRRLLPAATPAAGSALRVPFFDNLQRLGAAGRAAHSIARLRLAWLAWILLVVGAAQPQWLGEPVELPVSGRDLVLAVDVSGSMAQEDYSLNGRSVTRLDVVKAVGGRFIERREGDRLGLILFGSRAYVQTPLTYDRQTVDQLLREAVVGLAGRETALGDAITLAVKRLREQPEDNRVLVLLTDGANTAGNIAPRAAARLGAAAGVRIYTIGIGSGRVGIRTPFGTLMQVGRDLDPATLKAIADATGGRYFEATNTEQLEEVYADLDRLEPSVRDSRKYRPMSSLYPWPAGAALIIALALLLQGRIAGRARARGMEDNAHEPA
ncbi:MAG: VWA domain-containing protein [Gammaproteobacteria bacterium]|jgi:Ca-activated chloride channel family protein